MKKQAGLSAQAGNTAVWFVIVIVVIGLLVFITMRGQKPEPESQVSQAEESLNNMEKVEGVEITVLKEGTGEPAKAGDTVALNYTGSFEDGTVFDSNIDPQFGHVEPFVFILGSSPVIEGWDRGVTGMKAGEKRKLVISPEYAYGEEGATDQLGREVIPPNATLYFEVELLEVVN